MAYQGINQLVRFSKTGIDGKTVAATTIATPDSVSRNFVVISAIIRLTTLTSFTSVPVVSLGNNATFYNNIAASQALTGLDSSLEVFELALSNPRQHTSGNITLDISVGAVATTYTIAVDVIGYYL